jgi:hypothetical protein
MTAWLGFEPVGVWEQPEETRHRGSIDHPETGEKRLALRVRWPGGRSDGYREEHTTTGETVVTPDMDMDMDMDMDLDMDLDLRLPSLVHEDEDGSE